MHLHDDISRIADMDDISRIDLQGVALADLPVVTREMAYAGVETALGPDVGTRLPGQTVERLLGSESEAVNHSRELLKTMTKDAGVKHIKQLRARKMINSTEQMQLLQWVQKK